MILLKIKVLIAFDQVSFKSVNMVSKTDKMRSVRKLWSSDWGGQPYPGPDFLGGQTYVLAPFTNNRPDFWGSHGPPAPPITTSLYLIDSSFNYKKSHTDRKEQKTKVLRKQI